jgi:NAD-dependent SIR2 family protein deacetylase
MSNQFQGIAMPKFKPKIVIILGAGASKDAGAPVMNDFLDDAERFLLSGELEGEDRQAFEAVFRGIASLQRIYAKSYLELRNLEAVFAAFEMAELLNIHLDSPELPGKLLTDSIRRLIVVTLEKSIRFPVSDRNIKPTHSYGHLAQAIYVAREQQAADITIITFNYDIALDFALHYHNVGYEYCLDSAVQTNVLRLLKLHGSLNWVHCPDCNEPFHWSWKELKESPHFQELFRGLLTNKPSTVEMPVASWLQHLNRNCGKCGKVLALPQPVIVPPTWSKGEYHRHLQLVWQQAASALSEANSIVVSGYSLPETDHFFRYLFALGSISDTRLKRFVVLDPNIEKVSPLFQRLLGPMVKDRYEPDKQDFGGFVNNMIKYMGIA